MILKSNIIVDLNIHSLEDLCKLKPLMENSSLNINKSQIARELNIDRRTVDKYIHGFQKSKNRNKPSKLDKYHDIIQELLSDQNLQVFYYKRILWQYLVDNYELIDCGYSNFCHYINSHEEFAHYFKQKKPSNVKRPVVRFETSIGEQAQLDWKENIPFTLKSGEKININILVLLLSYSRFRVYRLSISKTQDVLFSLLNDGILSDTVHSELREYNAMLAKIGNNLNQIAKRMNATGNVYAADVKQVKELMKQVWDTQKSMLSKQPYMKQ